MTTFKSSYEVELINKDGFIDQMNKANGMNIRVSKN